MGEKLSSLTSSFRFSHRPHGLSSRISLSSSESSPLSLGDLCSDSLLLDLLPGMAMAETQRTQLLLFLCFALDLISIKVSVLLSLGFNEILFLYDKFTNKNIHKPICRLLFSFFSFSTRQSIIFSFPFSLLRSPAARLCIVASMKKIFQLDVVLFGNNYVPSSQKRKKFRCRLCFLEEFSFRMKIKRERNL